MRAHAALATRAGRRIVDFVRASAENFKRPTVRGFQGPQAPGQAIRPEKDPKELGYLVRECPLPHGGNGGNQTDPTLTAPPPEPLSPGSNSPAQSPREYHKGAAPPTTPRREKEGKTTRIESESKQGEGESNRKKTDESDSKLLQKGSQPEGPGTPGPILIQI